MLVLYRSRGLVKEWQDRSGNLLLQEFSILTPNVCMFRSRGLVKEWQDISGNLLLHEFLPYQLVSEDLNKLNSDPGIIVKFLS